MALPFLPSYDINTVGGAVALLLAMLVVGLFIHVAARGLAKKDDVNAAMAAAMAGIVLAQACYHLLPPAYEIVGILLAAVAFILAIGLFYRAKPQAAVSVGAVAWVLWILANFALKYVQDHWQ